MANLSRVKFGGVTMDKKRLPISRRYVYVCVSTLDTRRRHTAWCWWQRHAADGIHMRASLKKDKPPTRTRHGHATAPTPENPVYNRAQPEGPPPEAPRAPTASPTYGSVV